MVIVVISVRWNVRRYAGHAVAVIGVWQNGTAGYFKFRRT